MINGPPLAEIPDSKDVSLYPCMSCPTTNFEDTLVAIEDKAAILSIVMTMITSKAGSEVSSTAVATDSNIINVDTYFGDIVLLLP